MNEFQKIHSSEIRCVFINGIFSKELSSVDLPSYFSCSNEGLMLRIPKQNGLKDPIHLVYFNHPNDRNLIIAEEGVQAVILAEYISDSENHITQSMTDIHADNQAHISFYKIQKEHHAALHKAHLSIHQKQDSCVNLFNLTQGAHISREEILVHLLEKGSECYAYGLYQLDQDKQHTEHSLQVNHTAEQCTSSMVYKGILNKKSKALFHGKVHVHPEANQTHAHQANHTVLLSKEAEINTKPELEIYAENVKCTHGATVGQLDMKSLFYLQSRGVDKMMAQRILLSAFSDDVIKKISHPEIQHYIQKRVNHDVVE